MASAVIQGISAWPWKITARSSDGPVDRLAIDDDRAGIRRVEPGQDVQHRGLAAAGMPDQADEFAAVHAEPEIAEDDMAGIGARHALDRDIGVGHSCQATTFATAPSARSSSRPTTPISRMAMTMSASERLFHWFQTQ